ncbi:MAG: septum formation initiator family protein [Gammaproteobacteria bacterium]
MKRAAFTTFAIVFTALAYRLVVSDAGMRTVWRLGNEIEQQQLANDTMRQRNSALEAEVIDLRNGLEAIEERARADLGMTRESETFFQVVDTSARSGVRR